MQLLPALILVMLLGGCSAMRPTDPYQPIDGGERLAPVFWSKTQSTTIPEQPLTLQQAVVVALANNPGVAAQGWETVASQARRDQTHGARLPRLGIMGGYIHHQDEQRLLPASRDGQPGVFGRDIVSGEFVLTVPLFTGGRLINQAKAAELAEQAWGHRLVRSREELIFTVSRVFFNILAQRRVVESLTFSLQTLVEHLKRIEALVKAQKAAPVDRMRTEVRVADIEQQLVREKNLLAIHCRTLNSLLGFDHQVASVCPEAGLETPAKGVLPTLASAFVRAQKQRGDYLAARSSLEAQARTVDVAKSAAWPSVVLQGTYGGRWAFGPTTGAGDEAGDVGRVGLVMEIPIYEGGQAAASVREQRAALAAAQQRLRLLELQMRLEVETALLNIESSAERAAAMEKTIAQAKESLRIEQQKYNLGKGGIVDVLDAQSALLASETNYYRALADMHTALAQLTLAMGEE